MMSLDSFPFIPSTDLSREEAEEVERYHGVFLDLVGRSKGLMVSEDLKALQIQYLCQAWALFVLDQQREAIKRAHT